MTELDKIKESALAKLHEYVEFEIRELKDGKLSLSYFRFDPIDGYFSEEELKEIRRNIENISTKEGLIGYCKRNEIDLNNFKK